MGKKKWKQKARRRKILLDAQRSLKAYWKEEAQKRGRTLALYSLVLDGAELELEDARRWSSAWKAAAKKGRDEAKDYKGIAHDWYSWYQVAVDRLRVELSTAQVEAAQLREALENTRRLLSPDTKGVHFQGSLCQQAYNICVAALSTPADDWLGHHDEEVRREERERCATKCDEAEAVAEKEACEASPHGNLRSMFLAKAGQACALATAIREADNDQPSC
jgi:hypothetical protein